MRKSVFSAIAIVILISGASYGCTGAQQAERSFSVETFEFVVELSASQATFESRHGTSWTNLSWGKPGANTIMVWVNGHGVSGLKSSLHDGGFTILVEATADGAVFESSGGTTWSELSFGCSGEAPCKFIVNESGVRSFSKSK